jgi:YidC/Oxa1 family membrane protein insertase
MNFLYELFGSILRAIYNFVGSYGWSIVLFSIFAKVILIPLSIKQTKSMQMMKIINPKMQELQKKYASNKQKLNEETTKLYQQYHYNPLSGCLPLLIQFPIIIGLFGVLRMPDKYVFSAAEYLNVSQKFLWINNLTQSPIDVFKAEGVSVIFLLALIIPIISVVLTIWQQKQTSDQSGPAGQQKGMQIFMTIFIAYIGFTFSQGLAVYWTLQTALTIIQNAIQEKYFAPVIPDIKGGGKK